VCAIVYGRRCEFGLAQLTPGPNVIVVTLIGHHVAGLAGALVATAADDTWVAVAMTVATALVTSWVRINPLWIFAGAAALGLGGLV
jgi:chromate transporter